MDFKNTNIEYLNLHGSDITADGFEYLKEAVRETNIVEITTSYHAKDNPVVIKNDGLLSGKEAEINKFCEDNKTSYMPELLDGHHHVVSVIAMEHKGARL